MRRLLGSVLLVLLSMFTAPILGEELNSKQILSYASRSNDQRKALVSQIESEIRKLEDRHKSNAKAKRIGTGSYRIVTVRGYSAIASAKERKGFQARIRGKIKEYQIAIEKVNAPFRQWLGTFDDGRPGVGDIGKLVNPQVEIMQIQDSSSALARVKFGGDEEQTVFLRGFELGNATDDDTLSINDIVYIAGTETYQTAIGGTNTVLTIKPAPMDELKPYAERFTLIDQAHSWFFEDKNREPIKGFFDGYSRGQVSIKTLDKETIKVPLKELSDSDQKYAREKVKSRR